MVVDDNPANLKLLDEMLRRQGHAVRSFPLGRFALAAAAMAPPDLILLDINMPEMNGYEVCQRLKASSELSSIPVIFLSALREIEDKVKAFQTGAADYISKPFQFEEVHARVETHLKLHKLQKAMAVQNRVLEETVADRTRQLAVANARLTNLDKSKNEFLSQISHEFRTPLNGLLGVAEIILDEMPETKANAELRELFRRSRLRIVTLIDDALLLAHIDVNAERFRTASVLFWVALREAVEKITRSAESRRVWFVPVPEGNEIVWGDRELLERALCALLEIAVNFSEEGQVVRLYRGDGPGSQSIFIEGRGKNIPSATLERFFDPFSVGDTTMSDNYLGLRPPLAYRILSLFGIAVSVSNLDPAGVAFRLSFNNEDEMGSHPKAGAETGEEPAVAPGGPAPTDV